MFVGRDYDVADAGESQVYGIDFRNDMSASDTIVSVIFELTVASGTDPSPSSRLDGGPTIYSRTVVLQRVSDLISGVTYIIKATVQTSQDNTIVLWSRIPCEVIQ